MERYEIIDKMLNLQNDVDENGPYINGATNSLDLNDSILKLCFGRTILDFTGDSTSSSLRGREDKSKLQQTPRPN